MAPSEIEPELREGDWLVLVAAVWSGPDIAAISTALSAVKESGGRVKLGIRPFDKYEEVSEWCPDVTDTHPTPLWLILRDGRLSGVEHGVRTVDQIREMIRL